MTIKGHTDTAVCMAYSPDGSVIATGSRDKTIRLWNSKTGKNLRTLAGHTGEASSLAFCAAGKQLVSWSEDGTVREWDLLASKATAVLTCPAKCSYRVG
jgi:WD40 repeat protein